MSSPASGGVCRLQGGRPSANGHSRSRRRGAHARLVRAGSAIRRGPWCVRAQVESRAGEDRCDALSCGVGQADACESGIRTRENDLRQRPGRGRMVHDLQPRPIRRVAACVARYRRWRSHGGRSTHADRIRRVWLSAGCVRVPWRAYTPAYTATVPGQRAVARRSVARRRPLDTPGISGGPCLEFRFARGTRNPGACFVAGHSTASGHRH